MHTSTHINTHQVVIMSNGDELHEGKWIRERDEECGVGWDVYLEHGATRPH